MARALKEFLSGPLGHQVMALVAFYLLIWPLQVALVSLAAFFHLELGHPLGVIEQWLFAEGHWIMVISKLLAGGAVLLFVFQASPNRHPYRKVLQDRLRPVGKEVMLVVCVAAVLTLATGLPERSSVVAIDWLRVVTSLLGTCIFYGTDLYLIFALAQEFPLSPKRRVLVHGIAAILLGAGTEICFPFASGAGATAMFHFLTLLFLAHWRGQNATRPGVYLGLFLAPFAAFMGLDPIWGQSLSPFVARHSLGSAHAAILLALAVGYSVAKERNLFKHKYLAGP